MEVVHMVVLLVVVVAGCGGGEIGCGCGCSDIGCGDIGCGCGGGDSCSGDCAPGSITRIDNGTITVLKHLLYPTTKHGARRLRICMLCSLYILKHPACHYWIHFGFLDSSTLGLFE